MTSWLVSSRDKRRSLATRLDALTSLSSASEKDMVDRTIDLATGPK